MYIHTIYIYIYTYILMCYYYYDYYAHDDDYYFVSYVGRLVRDVFKQYSQLLLL